jgi:hypothetical protein
VESNKPQWIPAPPWLPRTARANRLSVPKSSVKVGNTQTGFSSRPGGTATNISRAPTSIPAAFGSSTGGSSKHMPLFRLRRLGFASRAGRLPLPFFFTACSLSELQATAKSRNRRYSSKRNQLAWPTVNHCSAHGTWSHAFDRRSNNTPLPQRPTSVARHSVLRCSTAWADTSSFPLCHGHRPGPMVLRRWARSATAIPSSWN